MKIAELDIPRSVWEHLIDEWIFSQRDRLIMKRRLLDGVCFEELAEEFHLSTQRVKSVVYGHQTKLFEHI